ncbi:MAG: hypothetical protein ABIJ44_01775 [Pseudomonadota bacterium]
MNPAQGTWKEIAWNGIRFRAPAGWQVGTIGKNYLMLEEESGPVLEVKWGHIKGTFSHEAHLHRLTNLHGKKVGNSVSECPLPAEWEEALEKYKATSFSWQGKTTSGKGLILFCTTCRNATLIQFYQRVTSDGHAVSRRLLGSFRDHRKDNQVHWSVFGIGATIPDRFHLIQHRFGAGEFELTFASKDQKIILYRWGPASVLLRNRDLARAARTMVRPSGGEFRSTIVASNKAVEWSITPPTTRWAHWWHRLTVKPSFQWFRLWHLEKKNSIFGVRIEGKTAPDPRFLERICAGYEGI